jgi:hypothetical protein
MDWVRGKRRVATVCKSYEPNAPSTERNLRSLESDNILINLHSCGIKRENWDPSHQAAKKICNPFPATTMQV